MAQEVADHDAIGVALADRYLVDPDGLGRGRAGSAQLLSQVLFLEVLDRLPVEMQLLGERLDGRRLAAAPDVEREALGVERIVGEPIELLLFHLRAAPALDPPRLDLEEDSPVATREVSNPAHPPVVPTAVAPTANSAGCFFERRVSVMTRAMRSPNTPTTAGLGVKPGKR